jgi:hypothetical protein
VLVGLVSVPFILACAAPAAPPVSPPVTTGAAHEYVVPVGTLPLVTSTGDMVNAAALHVVPVILLIRGRGLTVTVTVKLVPVQVAVAGVTVYVAVCCAEVLFVSVPNMVAWFVPAAPPVIPPVTTGATHVYVVAPGTMSVPFTGATEKATAVHVVAVLLAIVGFGRTVTVRVNVGPLHVPVRGVIVYVAVWLVFVGFVSVPAMLAWFAPAAPPVTPPVIAGTAHE